MSKTKSVSEEKWNAHLHFPKKWARYLALIPAIALGILIWLSMQHVNIDAKLDSTTTIAIHGSGGYFELLGAIIGFDIIAFTFVWCRNRIKQAVAAALAAALAGAFLGAFAGAFALAGAFLGAFTGAFLGAFAFAVEEDD